MVPQLDLLSQASVFITHTGMGGTGEAIYYGVPMIAIPQMEEQSITTRQIEKTGIGVAFLDKSAITSASLKEAIEKLLNDTSYRRTAKEFSQGILGQCCGIEPTEGRVYAPVDGEVTQVADTKHALGFVGPGEVEILIHVGVNTVDMNGDGFAPQVKVATRSKKASWF